MPSLIGNKPNQVPTNGDLGTLAFQDANAVNITGGVVDVSAGTAALPTLGTTDDENTGVFFPAADTVAVSTNGTERMRLDSSGNLGLGVTPSVWDAAGMKAINMPYGYIVSQLANQITFGNNAYFEGGAYKYQSSNPSSQLRIDNTGGFIFRTAPSGTAGNAITFTQAMTLDASGNLGIGTSSPGAILDVGKANNTGDVDFRFFNRGAGSANSSVTFGMHPTNLATRGGKITCFADNPGSGQFSMRFFTSNATIPPEERMRIDLNGNVVVGGTTAIKRLTVAGTGGGNVLALQRTNTNSSGSCGGIGFARETGYFNAAIELVATSSTSGDLVFRTEANSTDTELFNVTERMRITSDGYLRMASGSLGIQFNGDTAAANALDDYEEGTWTPALSGYTGTTYGVDGQQGWYTKIGNVVVMHFYIEITSVGTFVTNSRITGAPFGAGPAVTSAVGNQPTVLTALNETRADHYMAQYLGGFDIFVYNNAGTARNGNIWKAGYIAGTLVTISY
jgi:hypothetical protein